MCLILSLMSVQALGEYHGVSLNDYVGIGGSDIEGRLAVGHDLTISRYSVSGNIAPPTAPDGSALNYTTRNDLVVCGRANFTSGAVLGGGNMVYVDPTSVIRSTASVEPPGVLMHASTCPLDFEDVGARMVNISQGLAAMPRTGTAVIQYT